MPPDLFGFLVFSGSERILGMVAEHIDRARINRQSVLNFLSFEPECGDLTATRVECSKPSVARRPPIQALRSGNDRRYRVAFAGWKPIIVVQAIAWHMGLHVP